MVDSNLFSLSIVQPLEGLAQLGLPASVAAHEKRYSFFATVVSEAEDHGLAAVKES
jgi:hypothetical protein